MRPPQRSTMPFVCGRRGRVRRCSSPKQCRADRTHAHRKAPSPALERAVGELLAIGAALKLRLRLVFGQYLLDLQGRGLDEVVEEATGILGGLGRHDFVEDHACRALDGDEQIATLALIGHLWQVLDVDMEKSWLGLFEALVLRPLFLRQHRPQLAHAMPAQEAAVESGAGYLGTEILPRQRQQIIEGNFGSW